MISGPQEQRPTPPPTPPPAHPPTPPIRASAEISFWNSIKNSTNPQDFKRYLDKYHRGKFAASARNRLRALEEAARKDATRKEGAKPNEEKQPLITTRNPPPAGTIAKNWLGMELVYLWPESFTMGSNNGSGDEKPVHPVTIKEGFYMGRYEVTQAEWYQIMGNSPSFFNGDRLPVEQVSWDDVRSFLNILNQQARARQDEFEYRLPTEAEWEYACRAGTTGDYAGDVDKMAWHAHNSGNQSHPVGKQQPNAFGLYDMHGNVREWCEDWYHGNYVGAPTDGSAWLSGGEQEYRVLRGGSWYSLAVNLRSAIRYGNTPDLHGNDIGFRVVARVRSQ
ncbi:MAG TPA: formylglycine-generating enzyme family protein [Pyrinomonadaceae bacterium]